jgi:hypothetical protein
VCLEYEQVYKFVFPCLRHSTGKEISACMGLPAVGFAELEN